MHIQSYHWQHCASDCVFAYDFLTTCHYIYMHNVWRRMNSAGKSLPRKSRQQFSCTNHWQIQQRVSPESKFTTGHPNLIEAYGSRLGLGSNVTTLGGFPKARKQPHAQRVDLHHGLRISLLLTRSRQNIISRQPKKGLPCMQFSRGKTKRCSCRPECKVIRTE